MALRLKGSSWIHAAVDYLPHVNQIEMAEVHRAPHLVPLYQERD